MLDHLLSVLFAQADAAVDTTPSTVVPMLALLLVSTVPAYLIGYFLAKQLKMPDYAGKLGFIGLTIGLGIGVLVACLPQVGLATPKFGIDLKGGVILVYEINEDDTAAVKSESGSGADKVKVGDLVAALNERLNPGGVNEIQIRAYGERQVEIVVPDVGPEEVAAIKRQVENAGRLEFLMLATDPERDDCIGIIQADPSLKREKLIRNADGKLIGKWARVSIDKNKRTGLPELSVFYPNATYRDAVTGDLLPESRTLGEQGFIADLKKRGITAIDALMAVDPDPKNWVEGTHLATASIGNDQFGDFTVNFTMKADGAVRMGNLTGNNTSDKSRGYYRYMGIVLDGNLRSAPSINSMISDNGQITGNFSQAEVEFLVKVLRSGKLPAVLDRDPISENQINPLLGLDTINKGRFSIIVSVVAVLVFMVMYYRFAGVVACFALVVNTLLVVASMILMKAAFTLPGLAGMVLTVGMSVDANVLIYERIREELARGSALRMAIRNGFSRAMSSIIDGNLTTIITAVVLYVIGSEQLKGFAVTLILGIIMSMYTAIFCSRVIFDIVERKRYIKGLTMMDWWGKSNIDFVKYYVPTTAFSVVLIVIGLVAMVARGKNMFDIDFLGGTSIEMMLTEPMAESEVRKKLADRFDTDKTDFTLTAINGVENRKNGTIYKVDTSKTDVGELEKILEEVFQADGKSQLAINRVELGQVVETKPFGPAAELPAEETPPTKVETKTDVKPEEKKSEEKKSETAPPADEKKDETKKTDDKPAETPASDDKAKEEKPADAPPAPSGDQARRLDVPQDLLAVAFQDDAAEKKAEPAPAPETPKTETPATPAAPEAPATEVPAPVTPATETPAPVVSAPAVPKAYSQVEMTFAYEVNAPTLHMTLADAIEALTAEKKLERTIWDTESPRPTWLELMPLEKSPNWTAASSKKFLGWNIKLASTVADTKLITDWVKQDLEQQTVWQSASEIGGKVAGKTRLDAIWAILASLLGIIAYVWFRFHKLAFGIAAVVALIHDVLVTVGMIAISAYVANALGFLLIEEFKISLTVVAAILTLIGYSLNDTIVTFDRMREVKGKSPDLTAEMINRSINETLSRTFLTAGTTLIVVVILYAMGGSGIHAFAFSMLVGVIAGTYSSVFIAAPLLLWMGGSKQPTVAAKKPVEKTKVS